MKDKLFFDNDIILDASIGRDKALEDDVNKAIKLINYVELGKHKGYTSTIIFINTYYIHKNWRIMTL